MEDQHFSKENDYDIVHSIIQKELSFINLKSKTKLGSVESASCEAEENENEIRDDFHQPQNISERYELHHDNYFDDANDDTSYDITNDCALNNFIIKKDNQKIQASQSCKISFPLHLHQDLIHEKDYNLMKNKCLYNFQNSIDLLNNKPLSSTIYYQYLANNILTISSTSEGLDYFTKKLKTTSYNIIKIMLQEVRILIE